MIFPPSFLYSRISLIFVFVQRIAEQNDTVYKLQQIPPLVPVPESLHPHTLGSRAGRLKVPEEEENPVGDR